VTKYRLSQEAQDDLTEIKLHLTNEAGARVARYVLDEIRQKLRFLARAPGAGHLRQDLTDQPVRFWPVFFYLVVYDPAVSPLGVARILHGSQDLEALFKVSPPRA